jgi:hypothetical protein
VSRPAVKKAIDTGRIQKAVRPDGTIDAALADQLWAENTNPEKQANGWKKARDARPPKPVVVVSDPPPQITRQIEPKPAKAPKPPPALPAHVSLTSQEEEMDFNAARTKREIFSAKIAEIDYLERSKELVPISEVQRGLFNVLTILRTHVMGIHSKCRLQSDIPPHIVALIEGLCRGGLEDATKSLEELADGGI